MAYGLLIDTTLCVGCGQCEDACDTANGNPVQRDEKLHEKNFVYVKDVGDGVYARRQCMHCLEPACASVCPVGALQKTAQGPVTYDGSKCMGCRYCMMACPFHIPTYQWHSVNPKVRKCTMCSARTSQGKPTACSEACPTGATKFGDRGELLAEAQARIAAEPGKYIHRVFGEQEVGGTSVLYLAGVEFAKLGFPVDLPARALPKFTWDALEKIPTLVTAGVPLLAGIYWITKRREDVARDEGRDNPPQRLAGRDREDRR